MECNKSIETEPVDDRLPRAGEFRRKWGMTAQKKWVHSFFWDDENVAKLDHGVYKL